MEEVACCRTRRLFCRCGNASSLRGAALMGNRTVCVCSSGRLVSGPTFIRPRNRIRFAIEPILLHSESPPRGLHALVPAKCRLVRGPFGELCAILRIFQEMIRLLHRPLQSLRTPTWKGKFHRGRIATRWQVTGSIRRQRRRRARDASLTLYFDSPPMELFRSCGVNVNRLPNWNQSRRYQLGGNLSSRRTGGKPGPVIL